MSPGAPAEPISAARRVARTLDLFLTTRTDHGVSEVGHALGISKSVAHRILTALAEDGLLDRDPASRRYRLGPKIVRLRVISREQSDLARRAWTHMDAIGTRTGETVVLSLLIARRRRVHVQQTAGTKEVHVGVTIGAQTELAFSASGKAMLAYLPPDERVALVESADGARLPDGSTIEAQALLRELIAVRKRGYSIQRREDTGTAAIAAVVRDEFAAPVASLSVLCLSPLDAARLAILGTTVRDEAQRFSRRLGWSPQRSQ